MKINYNYVCISFVLVLVPKLQDINEVQKQFKLSTILPLLLRSTVSVSIFSVFVDFIVKPALFGHIDLSMDRLQFDSLY